MLVIIAFFSGIRNNHLLLALFFLSFSTICFGWVTEALSRPDPESRIIHTIATAGVVERVQYGHDASARSRHTRWEIAPHNPELLIARCLPVWRSLLAAVQRLGPHFLGWIPYIVMWSIVWDNFAYSTRDPDRRPPDFVALIIWSEIIIFSSFAVCQILQQSSDWGCRKYWVLELTYVALSILGKGMLGGILLANILLISGDVDDVLVEFAERA